MKNPKREITSMMEIRNVCVFNENDMTAIKCSLSNNKQEKKYLEI